MPRWLHRTTKRLLRSVPSAELPDDISNYIEEPDLSAVAGEPAKYWIISGDAVTLADQAARDAIDAQEDSDALDALAGQIENNRDIIRAVALLLLDSHNAGANRINAILAAINGASNLAQLKASIAAINDLPTDNPAGLRDRIRAKLS